VNALPATSQYSADPISASFQEAGTNLNKLTSYRKLAFANYAKVCAHCGFGIEAVLEVAHIDCDRANNDIDNLVILCPNCHKMHDLDIISTATIIEIRNRPKTVVWKKRMKSAASRRLNLEAAAKVEALAILSQQADARALTAHARSQAAGKKAAATRKRNQEAEAAERAALG
jgi:hypothetical protein